MCFSKFINLEKYLFSLKSSSSGSKHGPHVYLQEFMLVNIKVLLPGFLGQLGFVVVIVDCLKFSDFCTSELETVST